MFFISNQTCKIKKPETDAIYLYISRLFYSLFIPVISDIRKMYGENTFENKIQRNGYGAEIHPVASVDSYVRFRMEKVTNSIYFEHRFFGFTMIRCRSVSIECQSNY